ncbi:hypothetical protein ACFX14_000605 [Malus domestica]
MGFRSFKNFNDALLAKQCWRLIMEPNLLWALVLKARDILLKGAHWQIMDRRHVRIWVDRWLPSLPSSHPIPRGAVSVTKDTLVETLLCPISRTYDLNSLKPFIFMEELEAINDTYIGDSMGGDRFIWPITKNDFYTMKFGYLWAQARACPPTP